MNEIEKNFVAIHRVLGFLISGHPLYWLNIEPLWWFHAPGNDAEKTQRVCDLLCIPPGADITFI
jgi:hypothetical protein